MQYKGTKLNTALPSNTKIRKKNDVSIQASTERLLRNSLLLLWRKFCFNWRARK